jgi:hypothetical protein
MPVQGEGGREPKQWVLASCRLRKEREFLEGCLSGSALGILEPPCKIVSVESFVNDQVQTPRNASRQWQEHPFSALEAHRRVPRFQITKRPEPPLATFSSSFVRPEHDNDSVKFDAGGRA